MKHIFLDRRPASPGDNTSGPARFLNNATLSAVLGSDAILKGMDDDGIRYRKVGEKIEDVMSSMELQCLLEDYIINTFQHDRFSCTFDYNSGSWTVVVASDLERGRVEIKENAPGRIETLVRMVRNLRGRQPDARRIVSARWAQV